MMALRLQGLFNFREEPVLAVECKAGYIASHKVKKNNFGADIHQSDIIWPTWKKIKKSELSHVSSEENIIFDGMKNYMN